MKIAHNVTITLVLFGTLALAGHPVLAETADAGNRTSVFAQVQGQQNEQGTPGQPADQSPAMQGGRGGGGMMGGQQMMDPNMMSRMKKMHGRMMGGGSGMMGGPMGMCPMMTADDDKNFSAEQVRDILEGQIAWSGNKRLKVGSVEQKDEDSYLAEIVTVDDSLVQRLEVDRASGAMRPVE